jgi:hypothetical protein
MNGKAAHCLLHALHLRPNHPDALLAFATLFPVTDALHIYALGRVLAIGHHHDRVRECADRPRADHRHRGRRDPAPGRRGRRPRRPRGLAARPPDLGLRRSFFEGLDRLGLHASGPATPEDTLLASESGTRPGRPWWKFW